jgi:lysophospholipase L1-like esterase
MTLIRSYRNRIVLSLVSVSLTVMLTLLVDYLMGWVAPPGLVYPPNITIALNTVEFESTARINQLGFRGSLPTSPERFRVLTLGDSFTYGWGVNDAAAWPALLDKKLQARDCPAETANLGWVGKGPADYAEAAARAIPRLKPNLVVIAILQGDDLQQLEGVAVPSGVKLKDVAQLFYPNLSSWLEQSLALMQGDFRGAISGQQIQIAWQAEASGMQRRFSPELKARLAALDPDIRRLYEAGLINPHRIQIALFIPDYYLATVELTDPANQRRVALLKTALERINHVATAQQAAVLVLAVPQGIYVNQDYLAEAQRLGYQADPLLLSSDLPDRPIAQAAEQTGLPFVSALEPFRQSQARLFYPIDSHFTPAGHELLAESLAPFVAEFCHRRPVP